jgi:hypothetical protein
MRGLTGVKCGQDWRTWLGKDLIDDPENPGKKLWVPNFAFGLLDTTNHAFLARVAEIVYQDLKVSVDVCQRRRSYSLQDLAQRPREPPAMGFGRQL